MPQSQTADEVARQRADAALAPYFAEIEAQRAAAQREAAQRAAAIQGYSQAAAQMVGGVGQQVQQGYDLASQRQATFAKGFSDAMQQSLGQNANDANALLAKNGSPQQVRSNAAAAGDAVYGLGGFIPASTLNREGAAFGAAASMLPSTQLGYGAQALAQQQQDLAGALADFDAQRRKVESERPGIIQQALADIRANNLERQKLAFAQKQEKAANARDARDFKFKVAAFAKEYGLKEAEARRLLLKQGFDERATAARLKIQATNARTAQGRLEAQINRDLRRAGIDDEKLALDWANLEFRRRQANKKKTGKSGLTAKQRADFNGTAAQIAEGAFHGIEDDAATADVNESLPPIGYQEALREMYQSGVPLAIAQAALNRYYKPGERGRPKVSYQERQRRRRASQRQSQGAKNAPR